MADAPFPGSFLWPDPHAGPWQVTVWWRVQYGAPTPVGLDIRSWSSGRDGFENHLPGPEADVELPRMENQVLRDVKFREILTTSLAAVNRSLTNQLHMLDEAEEGLRGLAVDAAAARLSERERKRIEKLLEPAQLEAIRGPIERAAEAVQGPVGRDLGDDHYRQVAVLYLEGLAATGKLRPVQYVAERMHVSSANAAKYVARARARGFLPKTTKGRVGPGQDEL